MVVCRNTSENSEGFIAFHFCFQKTNKTWAILMNIVLGFCCFQEKMMVQEDPTRLEKTMT